MNEKQYSLVKVIQKIEVFADFDGTDVQQLLRVCHFRDIDSGEAIYAKGEPSDEMLILLRGRLRVMGVAGEELAQILPGMPIGEMGLFTGMPRSAGIVAGDDSKALVLRGSELALLLSRVPQMHIKILQNLVRILSRRVVDANTLAESQQRIIRDLERRLDAPEAEEGEDEEFDDEDDVEDDAPA